MLVACAACGRTHVYREERWERNANTVWEEKMKEKVESSLKFLKFVYSLRLRPLCNRNLLKMVHGVVELFPNSCAQTRWAAGDGWKRKEKRKEKIKISVFTLVHLLHPSSSSTVTRNHNHANIAHSCCIKECVEDAVGTRSIQWSPIPKLEHKGI